jgi:hypothetical protein
MYWHMPKHTHDRHAYKSRCITGRIHACALTSILAYGDRLEPITVEQEAVVMTDSTVVEVLAQCEAKLMRLMDSVEGDQAAQELEAQVCVLVFVAGT